jgi:hypothetical protein
MSRRFLGVLRQDKMSRAIRTNDLVFVADVKVHRRVAKRAATIATDNAIFNENGRLQMHDGCRPVKISSKRTGTKLMARPGPARVRQQRSGSDCAILINVHITCLSRMVKHLC